MLGLFGLYIYFMNDIKTAQSTKRTSEMKNRTFSISQFVKHLHAGELFSVEAEIVDRGERSVQRVGRISKVNGRYRAEAELFDFIKADEADAIIGDYPTLNDATTSLEAYVENLVIWENAERRTHKMACRVY